LDKSTKYDENHHRLCKSDSSLLSTNSNSPPLHGAIADSTTPTYLDNEQNSDATILNFPPIYHHHQFPSNSFYNTYPSDPSSMIYNPTYSYMGPTSGQTSSPMHFSPYGRYPTNNYNTPFFWNRIKTTQKNFSSVFKIKKSFV
jgi:hypothetical protein